MLFTKAVKGINYVNARIPNPLVYLLHILDWNKEGELSTIYIQQKIKNAWAAFPLQPPICLLRSRETVLLKNCLVLLCCDIFYSWYLWILLILLLDCNCMFVIFVQEERGPGQSPEGEGEQVLQCWGQHSGSSLAHVQCWGQHSGSSLAHVQCWGQHSGSSLVSCAVLETTLGF